MNVTMQTEMAFQVSGSSSAKQTASAQQEVREAFSFSAELKKQLNSLNKEADKTQKKAETTGASEEADSEQPKEKVKEEISEGSVVIVPPQILQTVAVPAMLPVTELPAQNVGSPNEVLTQQQNTLVQAISMAQNVPAVMPDAISTGTNASELPQQQSTEQPQGFADVLSQQSNGEAIQTRAPQSGSGLMQSGTNQNNAANAQTSGQSSAQPAQAVASTGVTEVDSAADKGEKGTTEQLTQQLSAFGEKLQGLGLSLKTEAAAAGPIPTAAQGNPSEQVASGVLNAYSDGKMEFTMKLKPESLGELTVKMVMNEGKLTMNIVTANQQTAKLIESQIPELRASLKENNIQMQNCTVENQSFNNLANSGNYFMSGSENGNQPYETHRIVLVRPIQEITADDTTLNVIGNRYLQQSMLNCYV